ncbi:lipopolysaccharide biosynthesis protein [Pseudobutyrivibrio xylanivorans]|nr:oligosaccharide flippase family protein [Pseudobutyrivibrio xylanivorans]
MNKAIEKYRLLPVQVRASLWFLVCSFLQKGISMITTPIFTRIMSPEDFGEFGVFNSWYGIIAIIVALGLTGGVHTQGLVKYENEGPIFTSSLQGLSLTLVAFWFAIYLLFKDFWNSLFSLSSEQMISMFILIWITAVFGFWANEQRVHYSYQSLVVVTLISSVIKPAVEIIFVMSAADKATARIIGWVICDIVMFGWVFFAHLFKGKIYFSKKFWTYALAFNIPLVPHYLSQTVLNSADRIMIQRMVGDGEAGIYNLAYSVSLIMTLFNVALTQTLNPWMYQKIKEKRITSLAPVAYTTLIIVAVVNLLLIVMAPEAVAIFAPKEYYDAIWVIPPVAMSVYFMYSYDLFAKFAFYYEKTGIIMMASIIGAILNVALNYIFIGKFGYMAAGYTTLVCFIIYAVAHYTFMRKVCRDCCEEKYPYSTSIILKITIPFLVAGFILMATYNYIYIRYGIVILTFIVAFVFRKKIIEIVKGIINIRKRN